MFPQAYVRLFSAKNAYGLDTPTNFVAAVKDVVIVEKASIPSTSAHPYKPLILAASYVTSPTSPPTTNVKNGISNGTSKKSWPPKTSHSATPSTSKNKIRSLQLLVILILSINSLWFLQKI